MRNLILAYAIRQTERRQTAFVVVYADHPGLPFANKVSGRDAEGHKEWCEFKSLLRPDVVPLHLVSYQELLGDAVIAAGNQSATWRKLQEWASERIEKVGRSRLRP